MNNYVIHTIDNYSYISNKKFLLPDVKCEERIKPWMNSTWKYRYVTCYPYILCSGGSVIETVEIYIIDPTNKNIKHCISESNYITTGPWESDVDRLLKRMSNAYKLHREFCGHEAAFACEKRILMSIA